MTPPSDKRVGRAQAATYVSLKQGDRVKNGGDEEDEEDALQLGSDTSFLKTSKAQMDIHICLPFYLSSTEDGQRHIWQLCLELMGQ